MNYYINTKIKSDLESASILIYNALQKEGFGIVTQFDVHKAFKEKLNIDFRPYRIMGACNPAFAKRSIDTEDKIGTILPCNVMLQQKGDEVEIAIVNPKAMVAEMDNQVMKDIAEEIYSTMTKVLAQL